MPTVTTFAEFFGGTALSSYESEDSIDYSFHLQLDHAGKTITYVNEDNTLTSFRAIVHKERKTKVETDHGFDEMVLREVKFPANNTTGRETVLLHAEIRVATVRYQIRSFERKADFWICELKRINVGEVSRPNRRGKV
jgi:hypothetical protein